MNEKEEKEVPVFIDGDTICFIPHSSEYTDLYIKWINHPKVRKYSRTVLPLRVDDTKRWFEPRERGMPNFIGFIIWHKIEKKPIGFLELSEIDWINAWANIGLTIGEPDYWNKNIATEAAELLIEYSFNELNLNKLQACAAVENIGSWSAAEKLGFEFEGIGKHDMYVDGNHLDEKRYRLLREDWMKRKEKD